MRRLSATVSLLAMLSLGATSLPPVARAQDPAAPDSSDGLRQMLSEHQTNVLAGLDPSSIAAPDAAPLEPEELDKLVAPVALYPDALLAQVLVAATYPLQIVNADRLIDASKDMSDDELSDAVAKQKWDPSVLVLLSGFPTVVQRMADDLEWTEQLGSAMVSQDNDVLAAVQRMRAQAEGTGYLTSNAAQKVEKSDGQIYIKPADPDVVYVPSYDATAAYTTAPTAQPYIAPAQSGFSPSPLVAGAVAFGAALLIQELFGNNDKNHNDNNRQRLERLLARVAADRLAAAPVLPPAPAGGHALRRSQLELGARPLLGSQPAELAPRRRRGAAALRCGTPAGAAMDGA